MDAGYALLLEEYSRAGVPLHEALEQTAHMRAGGPSVQKSGEEPVLSEDDLVKQNQSSMRELQQMMGGL